MSQCEMSKILTAIGTICVSICAINLAVRDTIGFVSGHDERSLHSVVLSK